MRVVFLGKLADVACAQGREEAGGAASIARWIAALPAPLGPALADPRVRFAINGALAGRDAALEEDDELACLPPVSGG